jgi:hypothetical protein
MDACWAGRDRWRKTHPDFAPNRNHPRFRSIILKAARAAKKKNTKPQHLVKGGKGKYYYAVRRNGRVRLKHHLVVAQKLGRKLERGERVHHKNGNTLDNRPENLELFHWREGAVYAATTNGRWARHFDQCIRCNSRKHQHWGKGVCHHCNYLMRKAQGYFPRKNSLTAFPRGAKNSTR